MYHIEHLHDCVHHKTSKTTFPTADACRDALAKIFARCYGVYPIADHTQDSFSFYSKGVLHTLKLIEI